MKKLALIALLPIALMLSGCANMGDMWNETWGGYDYHNQMMDGHMQSNQYVAHDGSVRTYRKPRQYHVTTQDVEKYNSINDRIAKRKAQLQQQNSTHLESTNPANAQSIHSAPSSSTYNQGSHGETNY